MQEFSLPVLPITSPYGCTMLILILQCSELAVLANRLSHIMSIKWLLLLLTYCVEKWYFHQRASVKVAWCHFPWSQLVYQERMRPLGGFQWVPFSVLTVLIGWKEGFHPVKTCTNYPKWFSLGTGVGLRGWPANRPASGKCPLKWCVSTV